MHSYFDPHLPYSKYIRTYIKLDIFKKKIDIFKRTLTNDTYLTWEWWWRLKYEWLYIYLPLAMMNNQTTARTIANNCAKDEIVFVWLWLWLMEWIGERFGWIGFVLCVFSVGWIVVAIEKLRFCFLRKKLYT